MKTTLNFPDDIIAEAKIRAVREKTTLTDLIVQGLKMKLTEGKHPGGLPVSGAGGGLLPEISWEELAEREDADGAYR